MADLLAQTTDDAQRLLERISNVSKRKDRRVQGVVDIGHLVTLSVDYERFGGESGPLQLGEVGTVLGSEDDGENIRFASLVDDDQLVFSRFQPCC